MTPKEKAEELIDKFRNNIISFLSDNMKDHNAQKCALVAVDELIKQQNNYNNGSFYPSTYWNEVKEEIENYDGHNR